MLFWTIQLAMIGAAAFAMLLGRSASLAAAMIVLPGLVRAFVMSPGAALGLTIGSYVFQITMVSGGGFYLTPYKIISIAFIARVIVDLTRSGPRRLPSMWLLAGIGILLAHVLMHGLFEADTAIVGDAAKLISFGLISVAASQQLRHRRDVEHFQLALLGTVVVVGIAAAAKLGTSVYTAKIAVRAKLLGNDPNYLGTSIVGWLWLGSSVAFGPRWTWAKRGLFFAGVASMVYLLFVTASRGVTVAAIFSLAVAPFLVARSGRGRAAIAALGVMVVVVGINLAPEAYVDRLMKTVEFDAETGHVTKVRDSMRRELVTRSLELISDAPLLGGGPKASARKSMLVTGKGTVTHSSAFRFAESYGLLALALVLLLLARGSYATLRMWRSPEPEERAVGAAMLMSLATVTLSGVGLPTTFPREMWFLICLQATLETKNLYAPGTDEATPEPATGLPRALAPRTL